MKRSSALRVALMTGMAGTLLMGCSSDSETTSTTPPADLLVGTWLTQGPSDEPIVVLELTAEGTWTYKWGQTRETVSLAGTGYGTYEVDGDTVTWLGGECEPGAKGVYTFTLENGQFSQTVKDDSCRLRKLAYDGVTFTAETASTSSSGG